MADVIGSKDSNQKVVVSTISADTILYWLYLQYKCNMLSRDNLKTILAEIKKPTPEDVAKYLVSEVAKGY